MVLRIDAWDKLNGSSKYVADLIPDKCLFGAVVRSPIAKGKLLGIKLDKKFNWSNVTVVTKNDIPGENIVPFKANDMPCLADKELNFIGEAIALVAAPSIQEAKDAANHINIKFKEENPVIGIEAAKKANLTSKTLSIEDGEVENIILGSKIVVEGEYKTGFQEQAYIETQGILATPSRDSVHIIGSMQCPYYILPALENVLAKSSDKISVKQATVGGAFGGKEDYPSHLACYTALLAIKSRKPVAIIYDRMEDILFTTKRHASAVHHKTAVDENGNLLAMDINVELDGGAYSTLSSVVLARAILHASGTYSCPHVRVNGTVWKTNIPPCGAFRGFGAPQTIFAIERHMDKIAKQLNMNPYELRRRNAYKLNDKTPTGQTLKESVSAIDVLEDVVQRSRYNKYNEERKTATPINGLAITKRGMGIALSLHGGGFTGSGENIIKGKARVRVALSDVVNIEVSAVEMGQGAHTILSQIAADTLELPIKNIRVEIPDTAICPDSGPTVASRTTMVVGKIVEDACIKLHEKISKYGDGLDALKAFFENEKQISEECTYSLPPEIKFDDNKMKGDAYPTYSWAATVAEVEVNSETGVITPLNIWVSVDAGKIINKQLALGQVEGGTVQALGWAIFEKGDYENGLWNTKGLETYMIPTIADVPPMHINFIENAFSYGPQGAKGLGELPMDGPAAAIANAISIATQNDFDQIPILPESVIEVTSGK